MERARATWSDERLDDLARRVDSGFARVDHDLRELKGEMSTMRAELGARIERQGARIDAQGAELGARIDALQRTMIQVGGAAIFTLLAGFAGVIATQIA